jgi:hypothetical protein
MRLQTRRQRSRTRDDLDDELPQELLDALGHAPVEGSTGESAVGRYIEEEEEDIKVRGKGGQVAKHPRSDDH